MEDNQKYKKYLTELSNIYNEIKKYFELEYGKYLYNNKKLEINFSTQFYISKREQDNFISYEKKTKKFSLYLENSISIFNKIKNTKINMENDNIFQKLMDITKYNFTNSDLSLLIRNNKMTFEDYIKGQFIHEIFKSLIDLSTEEKITYSDSYGNYTTRRGTYYTEIVIESFTRIFCQKHNISYLPNTVKDIEILRITNNLIKNKKYLTVLLNEDINILLNEINNGIVTRMIMEFENKCFEEQYKLKNNTIKENLIETLTKTSIIEKKREIIDKLKELKETIKNNKKEQLDSFGYANIIQIVLFLLIIFSMSFLLIKLVIEK